MTKNSAKKKRIRELMQQFGINYTQAMQLNEQERENAKTESQDCRTRD